jgi:2-C-methyl-D-erythritol 4-phosphate cytidylyltransferase
MARTALILAAAGSGSRFGGDIRKPYVELLGRPIFLRTLERLAALDEIVCRILVVSADDVDFVRDTFAADLDRLGVGAIVPGGPERHDSVRAALAHVPETCELVAIHDAVRPLVPIEAVAEALRVAEKIGAAVVGVPVHDTIKRTGPGNIVEETPPRDNLWLIQTPQVFRTALLRQGYARIDTFAGTLTDDSQLVESLGHPVAMVVGGRENLKITTPEDLRLAEAWLRASGEA